MDNLSSSKGTYVYVLIGEVSYEGDFLLDVYNSLLKAQASFDYIGIEDWKENEDENGKRWSAKGNSADGGYHYYVIYQKEIK